MDKSDGENSQKPANAPVPILVDKIPGPDFTVYEPRSRPESAEPKSDELKSEKAESFEQHLLNENTQESQYSRSSSFLVTDGEGRKLHARGLACSSYGGRFWSVSLRCDKRNDREAPASEYYDQVKRRLSAYAQEKDCDEVKLKDVLGYYPEGHPRYESVLKPGSPKVQDSDGRRERQSEKESFLNDMYQLCRQLRDVVLPAEGSQGLPNGLIAITGATDSSKSLIARGIIFLFLEAAAQDARQKRYRKPHLLTFEEPIEEYYIKDPSNKSVPSRVQELRSLLDALYLDYTPREKPVDENHLRRLTEDALRQTPALLFVGETRNTKDWGKLLDFAGSGHLVITTSHAGSVIEAMSRILRDTKSKTPAQRSEIARRIVAIVNVHSHKLSVTKEMCSETGNQQDGEIPSHVRVLLPALWKSTPQARNNLIADGLASILPARERESEIGYYGRTYFANELCKQGFSEECRRAGLDTERIRKELTKIANKSDVEGV